MSVWRVSMLAASVAIGLLSVACAEQVPERGKLQFQPDPAARFDWAGMIGERSTQNVEQWLLTCPRANPGLLTMFAVRDRQPAVQLVPWAGEFVGKYLISAIQALRMEDDPRLVSTVEQVMQQVIGGQAEDGYLGPFPREQRLLGNWDLWGHYHVMLALLMWHERTGDEQALASCRRAADLICQTYRDAGRSTLAAGSHEMNMAVIHVLARLYRETGEKRYMEQARQIERDWQQAGDYLRSGLAGVPFHRTPRPRWESLHDLQGLVELYRITGDDSYRRAYLQHWKSICDWDRRNTGGFSSGEQATGNPYEPTPIETCCTIAWMALSIDALALSGDSIVADELELSTYNAMLGAQHPSGRWWTYDTPMDGRREASAHTIVFQSRAGTPELNCCSVNAPRGLGMLTEWGLMRDDTGLVVNYYGPGSMRSRLADGTAIAIEQQTAYPWQSTVQLRVQPEKPARFTLKLRIPTWSQETMVDVDGEPITVSPGSYVMLDRRWTGDETVTLRFDLRLRYEPGDWQAAGKASLYRGPVLLAFDQALNAFDAADMPELAEIDALLDQARVEVPDRMDGSVTAPWLVVEIPAKERVLRLCDFASAGAGGTHYKSWLPARGLRPATPVAEEPYDGATLPRGKLLFTWRAAAAELGDEVNHRIEVLEAARAAEPMMSTDWVTGDRLVMPEDLTVRLQPGVEYFWKCVAINRHGESASAARRFQIDADLPLLDERNFSKYAERADGAVFVADLAKDAEPEFGTLVEARGARRLESEPGLSFDGKQSRVTYKLKRFPERDYTLAVWCRLPEQLSPKLQQVASAWCAGGDDPLRLCLDKGKLHTRMESHHGYFSSDGIVLAPGAWHHLAVVKAGPRLTLFVDGQERAAVAVPERVMSGSRDLALGGNPHFGGDEYLTGDLRGARFYVRALSLDEIAALAAEQIAPANVE